jgi:hypothetical protein
LAEVITKAGLRLSSVVCDTEVIVIKAPKEDLDLRCGGTPMVELADATARSGEPVAPHDAGTLIGKRYASGEPAVEVLCTKAGSGSLSIGDEVLAAKEASPLPSSD